MALEPHDDLVPAGDGQLDGIALLAGIERPSAPPGPAGHLRRVSAGGLEGGEEVGRLLAAEERLRLPGVGVGLLDDIATELQAMDPPEEEVNDEILVGGLEGEARRKHWSLGECRSRQLAAFLLLLCRHMKVPFLCPTGLRKFSRRQISRLTQPNWVSWCRN